MLQNIKELPSKDFSGGLNTTSIFNIQPNETPDAINVKYNVDGSMQKRPGYIRKALASSSGFGIFDYGVATINNVIVACGTGVFYTTDLGASYVQIQTGKSASITHFNRIKDYAIYTDDAYDPPYYWTGSSTTQMELIAPGSAPACRFTLDFQGYGLFMNHTANTLKIYYQDANTLLSGRYVDYFTLAPAERSDAITGGTVLNNKAYVFTKYKIFRLTYVGGNPDFAYTPVKSFGFVPGAYDKVNMGESEFIVGLCYDKRIRVFDGGDDKVISDKIEFDNGVCPFHLIDIQDNAIEKSSSVKDTTEQVWKLNLCMAPSNYPTHTLCLDLRSLSYYVYQYSSKFVGMVMTESANKQYLVSLNTQGHVCQMNTSNTDETTPITEYHTSPTLYDQSPSKVNKTAKIDFFFATGSCNNVYLEDRTNFDNAWKTRETFLITNDSTKNQIKKAVDIPLTFNAYQYKISSSSGTAEAWKLTKADVLMNSKGYGQG